MAETLTDDDRMLILRALDFYTDACAEDDLDPGLELMDRITDHEKVVLK